MEQYVPLGQPLIYQGPVFSSPVLQGPVSQGPVPQGPVIRSLPPEKVPITVGIEPIAFTTTKKGLNTGIIIIVIIGGLVIITLIILLFWYQHKTIRNDALFPTTPIKPQPPNSNSIVGSSPDFFNLQTNCRFYQDELTCTSGNGGNTRNWNTTGFCTCDEPFWSLQGNREVYDGNYFAVGQPNIADLEFSSDPTVIVDRLSFPFEGNTASQTECTVLCDGSTFCTGVIWKGSTAINYGTEFPSAECTLITGNVIVPSDPKLNVPFNPNIDATMYLKSVNSLLFTDRVYLYNTGTLPYRFWLSQNLDTPAGFFLEVPENKIVGFQFRPTKVLNAGKLTGVYSTVVFDVSQAPSLIVEGDTSTTHINFPDTPLVIPTSFFKKPIYVTYIKYP